MEQFRFAFLVMSPDHSPENQHACFDTPLSKGLFYGVSSVEQACQVAKELADAGEVCKIELCGAFGPDGARRIIEATGNRIPVGYVTHLPEQEAVYRAAFPND